MLSDDTRQRDTWLAEAMAELPSFYDTAEAAWRDEGRPGKPWFASSIYFAIGQKALERAKAYSRSYFGFMGPNADRRAATILTTPKEIKDALNAFADVGTDELTFHPGLPELEQLGGLADLVA